MSDETLPAQSDKSRAGIQQRDRELHTPGPWEMADSAYKTSDGEGTIFSDGDWHIFPPLGELGPIAVVGGEANARLIAAAPELLRDLEEAIEGLDEVWEDCHSVKVARFKATIAKARGLTKQHGLQFVESVLCALAQSLGGDAASSVGEEKEEV